MVAYNTGDQVASILTNNKSYGISQLFGVNEPSVPDWWYAYSADVGLKYGDHAGIDIAVPFGTPIYAIEEGDVIQSGLSQYFRPYPIYIQTAAKKLLTIYGHLSKNVVSTGQRVKRGQLIGYSGFQTKPGEPTVSDGSGAHIHLETRVSGMAVDPLQFMTPGAASGSTGSEGGSSNVTKDDLLKRFGFAGTGALLVAFGVAAIAFAPIRKAVIRV